MKPPLLSGFWMRYNLRKQVGFSVMGIIAYYFRLTILHSGSCEIFIIIYLVGSPVHEDLNSTSGHSLIYVVFSFVSILTECNVYITLLYILCFNLSDRHWIATHFHWFVVKNTCLFLRILEDNAMYQINNLTKNIYERNFHNLRKSNSCKTNNIDFFTKVYLHKCLGFIYQWNLANS